MQDWQILVVDDEPDVHAVTDLALRNKRWRGRKFATTSAASAKEAEKILEAKGDIFDVAFIDVVMETDHAGLDLVRTIRRTCERSLRIVLRTGQPGIAPEEKVLNDYDIDAYLAKPDATPERLYSLLRSALRASQDLRTLQALRHQLEGFATCFQRVCLKADLEKVMSESLKHLEYKFAAKINFFANIDTDVSGSERLRSAVAKAREKPDAYGKIFAGTEVGLKATEAVVPLQVKIATQPQAAGFFAWLKKLFGDSRTSAAMQNVDAGFAVAFESEVSSQYQQDFLQELHFFSYNWVLAYSALCAQEDVAYQRALQEYQRRNRIEAPRSA